MRVRVRVWVCVRVRGVRARVRGRARGRVRGLGQRVGERVGGAAGGAHAWLGLGLGLGYGSGLGFGSGVRLANPDPTPSQQAEHTSALALPSSRGGGWRRRSPRRSEPSWPVCTPCSATCHSCSPGTGRTPAPRPGLPKAVTSAALEAAAPEEVAGRPVGRPLPGSAELPRATKRAQWRHMSRAGALPSGHFEHAPKRKRQSRCRSRCS